MLTPIRLIVALAVATATFTTFVSHAAGETNLVQKALAAQVCDGLQCDVLAEIGTATLDDGSTATVVGTYLQGQGRFDSIVALTNSKSSPVAFDPEFVPEECLEPNPPRYCYFIDLGPSKDLVKVSGTDLYAIDLTQMLADHAIIGEAVTAVDAALARAETAGPAYVTPVATLTIGKAAIGHVVGVIDLKTSATVLVGSTDSTVAQPGPDGWPAGHPCASANPPRWCWVADLGDFAKVEIMKVNTLGTSQLVAELGRFDSSVGYVDPDDYDSPCLQPNPPSWCRFAGTMTLRLADVLVADAYQSGVIITLGTTWYTPDPDDPDGEPDWPFPGPPPWLKEIQEQVQSR